MGFASEMHMIQGNKRQAESLDEFRYKLHAENAAIGDDEIVDELRYEMHRRRLTRR